MRSDPRSKVSARHRAVTRTLAKALCDAGIDAVDAVDFLDGVLFVGGTVEDVAQGRTLVAWDVDYVDPTEFPLKDHRGVLVVRFLDNVPTELLVQSIVQLACTLRDQETPKNIIVLEPVTSATRGRAFADKPKAAA